MLSAKFKTKELFTERIQPPLNELREMLPIEFELIGESEEGRAVYSWINPATGHRHAIEFLKEGNKDYKIIEIRKDTVFGVADEGVWLYVEGILKGIYNPSVLECNSSVNHLHKVNGTTHEEK